MYWHSFGLELRPINWGPVQQSKPNISPSFLSSVKCQPVPRPNPRWPIYIIHSIDNTKSSNPRESPRYLEVLKDKTDSSLQMKVCRLLNRALNTKSYLSALYVRSIMIPSEASSSLSRALGSVLRNVSWKLNKMQRKISFYIMLITFKEKC